MVSPLGWRWSSARSESRRRCWVKGPRGRPRLDPAAAFCAGAGLAWGWEGLAGTGALGEGTGRAMRRWGIIAGPGSASRAKNRTRRSRGTLRQGEEPDREDRKGARDARDRRFGSAEAVLFFPLRPCALAVSRPLPA